MKMNEFGPPGRGARPWRPLGSDNDYFWLVMNSRILIISISKLNKLNCLPLIVHELWYYSAHPLQWRPIRNSIFFHTNTFFKT